MKKVILRLIGQPLRAGIKWYLSKTRVFRYKGLTITVAPGVFHPGLFFSTRFLIDYLETQPLAGKTFLELGCGSGLISILAAKKGAIVTASDINSKAVQNTTLNSVANQVTIRVLHSDLFEHLEPSFEWIVINPPYYPAHPEQEEEYAWYCGEEHEYFEKLFGDLKNFIRAESTVLMVLSDVCDLEQIFSIASRNSFAFEKILEKNVWADGRNYLYWIKNLHSLPKSDMK
jgi:release factor glutamine methyltransferase